MSTPTSQPARKRIVHQLDTPFSAVSWPAISSEDQDTILELLCNLLSPLGQHRQTHTKRSKGKRAAKREKDAKKTVQNAEEPLVPPVPEIETSIDVGLNCITRNLQTLSQGNAESMTDEPQRQYAMMVAASSKHLPPEDKIRLVGFSKPCSERLSVCLGVPRVSSIAIIKDAPGAGALLELVTKIVAPVEAAWLDGSRDSQYLATKINAIETTAGPKRPRNE
ncbi:hypothetical protein FZEAL_5232 [Fusarium zealandicum]|uniref:Uncharacterized protein n=1 Tax=Fusarium zealandicum TaxID=1053134 RepID=A0A8H4UL60_9HYPO|nr:hypothetical protein FZEAL_5232 [Fusarium zealandicum]